MSDPWARLGGELQDVPPTSKAVRLRAFLRSGAGIAGVVALGAVALILYALVHADDPPPRDANGLVKGSAALRLDDLATGDCVLKASSEDTYTLSVVPCSVEHEAQVIEQALLPDEPYPGDEVLQAQVEKRCDAALADFVGDDSRYDVAYYYPDAPGWSYGDRGLVCLLVNSDDAPLLGSVRRTL